MVTLLRLDLMLIGSGENLRGMMSYGRRIRMRREMGKKRAAEVEKPSKALGCEILHRRNMSAGALVFSLIHLW